jgi:hypothetical protein
VLPHQNTEEATTRLVQRKSLRYSGSIPWRNPVQPNATAADVAGDGPGDADLEQQVPVLALAQLGGSGAAVRGGPVAERSNATATSESFASAGSHHAGGSGGRSSLTSTRAAGQRRDALDDHTHAAQCTLEVEIGRQEPSGSGVHARATNGVVELLVVAPRHRRREQRRRPRARA